MEAGKPKTHRAGQQARNSGDVAILSLKTARESRELETQAEFLRCRLEANCFLGKAAVFVRPSTDWMRPITLWRVICFTQVYRPKCSSPLKYTFTAISRLVFDPTTGCHRYSSWQLKLTITPRNKDKANRSVILGICWLLKGKLALSVPVGRRHCTQNRNKAVGKPHRISTEARGYVPTAKKGGGDQCRE